MAERDPMSKALLVITALACLVACKKDDPPSTPTLAASAVVAAAVEAGPTSMKYAIDPTGTTSIDMPAPSEHIKATTSATSGEIIVDPAKLEGTRGQVKADLSTLTTSTFGVESKDKSQTEHAHNWLEAGDLVPASVKAENRWAIFTIESIEGPAATDLSAVPAVHGASDDTRTVSVTAKGQFFVHGHQVPKSAELDVVFHYATGESSAKKATMVEIKTKTPLHVALADHDVKPRDAVGKLAQKSFDLLGTKVAETADVTFDLTAHPAR
jgi:hypothetical protein